MGWKRRGSKPIELVFHFATLRNFTRADLFASNRFGLGIRVFSRATLEFSRDGGRSWSPAVTSFEYVPDAALQESRTVAVPIKGGRVGDAVRVGLDFGGVWILVSEVGFDSHEVAAGAVLPDHLPPGDEDGEVDAVVPEEATTTTAKPVLASTERGVNEEADRTEQGSPFP